MNENRSLLEELCSEALEIRMNNIRLSVIEEVANEVRNALAGGMDKKEFAKWFDVLIAEHKSKYTTIRYPRGW